jgi:hypothetical protein
MTLKHEILKGTTKGINLSMVKINLRNEFIKSRKSEYYLCRITERNCRNSFNKELNKLFLK